jgi:hypothetical protein
MPARLQRPPGRPSNEEQNELRVIPLHVRNGFARFLDRAADAAKCSRAELVREGSALIAEKILGERRPEVEAIGPGKKTK